MRKAELLLLMLTLLPASQVFAQAPSQKNDAAAAATQAPMQGEPIPVLPALHFKDKPANEEERLAREVRHELVMLPYYSIWDWLAFRVNGRTVELLGAANTVGLKRDAVASVKQIEGVEKVIDNIQQLPPSPMDDRIRQEVARSIFSFGSLSRYSWESSPSIHIIVNQGRVRLVGVVDNQADKDAAGLRANSVQGVFQVTNDLKVVKGS